MNIVFLLIGILIGGVIGFFFASNIYQRRLSALESELRILQSAIEESKQVALRERHELQSQTIQLAKTIEQKKHLEEQLANQKEELMKLQEKFRVEFENIANKLLEEKSKKFAEQNKYNLKEILDPLSKQIKDFEHKVEETNKQDHGRYMAMKEELRMLKELNLEMSTEAKNLTHALKGSSKAQGNWGEMILERVLEHSGLKKDREYETQTSITSKDGKRYFLDVVVHLPDNKKVIIDSKVSLTAYEQYVNASEDEKPTHIKTHIASIRNHIKGLAEKQYQTLFSSESLDFVLLFIPIESAFSLAIEKDHSLFMEAYNKNIVMVTPSTLLATLKTIATIWKNEYQNRNVLEIADRAGKLYDKFVLFLESLQAIGDRLDQGKREYNTAMNRLKEGHGNLISSAEKIKQLGAKAQKSIPKDLLD